MTLVRNWQVFLRNHLAISIRVHISDCFSGLSLIVTQKGSEAPPLYGLLSLSLAVIFVFVSRFCQEVGQQVTLLCVHGSQVYVGLGYGVEELQSLKGTGF